MDTRKQARYYDLGRDYWWLVGKYRVIIEQCRYFVLPRVSPSARWRLLDVGCGPGNMLDLLSAFGPGRARSVVFGADYSLDALLFSKGRGYTRLFALDAQMSPVRSGCFDLVSCVDVIEHLADDGAALREVSRVLRPGGHLVLTAPAFMSLWGSHDTMYGHKRRYTVREVRRKVTDAGLRVVKCSYFEPAYFVPLFVFRRVKRLLFGLHRADDFVALPRWLNRALGRLLSLEARFLKRMDFPFGVTLVCIAQKGSERSGGTDGGVSGEG